MTPDSFVWEEYDFAALDMAKAGKKGVIGDPLPELLSERCLELINDNPEAFAERVRQSAYMLAMERKGSYHGQE